ncbi:DNA polymerase delta subunit 2 [Thelohanellus kitauei]|uniref:DNA polymerase delta subunit 2 n=1 Tax=Thelohanellus kitauei TaxID=669202 RepID=A0A0C2JGQ4_THEKT|nr:DNA polymerase delta subunit 2 [Thelohanellus kitauei]
MELLTSLLPETCFRTVFQLYHIQKYVQVNKSPHAIKDEHKIVSYSSKLDKILLQISCKIQVFVMPGKRDPVTHFIPQQPIHECFFPQSSKSDNFHLCTNPFKCQIDEYEILGTDGQNVKSIYEYSRHKDTLESAEFCLAANLIFPNAPENIGTKNFGIGCYQFSEFDPLVIDNTPRLLFYGSSDRPISKIFDPHGTGEKFAIVGVPAFSEQLCAVKVNLDTLEVGELCV